MSTATLPEPTKTALPSDALYEVVNGEIVEVPEMSAEGQQISNDLNYNLRSYLEGRSLGLALHETLFVIDEAEGLKRRPDVAFVSVERWPLDRRGPSIGDWPVVPDLAVEVVSPNDVMYDVMAKVAEYFHHGVREVWVVVPNVRKVYVHTAPDASRSVVEPGVLETPMIPGWQLPLAKLFWPR